MLDTQFDHQIGLETFNEFWLNVFITLLWHRRGLFPICLKLQPASWTRGVVSTIFCYKHFLPSLIISYVPTPIPNARTNFHNASVRVFLFTSFTDYSTGIQRGTTPCSNRTSGERRPVCGWSMVWLPGPSSARHPSVRWLDSTSASAKLNQASLP